MPNPFQETGPVRGDAFCDRVVEADRALERIESGEPVLVQGGPEVGTSSFLLRIRERLRDRGWAVATLDLWRSDGPAVLAEEMKASVGELSERLGKDAGRQPSSAEPDARIEASLAALGRLAQATDRRVALVADEAQRAEEIDGVDALAALRELSRGEGGGAGRVTLVLGGRDRPGDDPGDPGVSPLGSPLRVHLGPIPLEAWLPFVLERFLETDRWIENRHVERLVGITGGHPARTQAVLHALWGRVERNHGTEDGDVEAAVETAVRRRGSGYDLLWRTLTPNQRRVLRGLALEGPGARPFSAGFVRRHHLASPSSAQRALEALESLRLVRREDDGPVLEDLFLRRWLRARSSAAVDA